MSTLPMHCTVIADAPQTIWLPDGGAFHLHRVNTQSARAVSLRAMRKPHGWLVFDLYDIAPELREELCHAPQRDIDGLVLYRLRAACPTIDDFIIAAARAADAPLTRKANGWAQPEEAAC